MRSALSVIRSVILSVCRITAKVITDFIEACCYDWAYQSKELINFCDDPDTDSRSLFHFPRHCGIGDFRNFISISRTVTGRFSRHSSK